jgi:hypothetical protein
LKLVVHELKAAGLFQTLRPDKRTIVEAIRPHLYRHNFTTGSLRVQIWNDEDLIAESNAVEISSIGTAAFFHGYVRFDIDAYLQKDTDYQIYLYSDGLDPYEFNESSYIGWCNGYDLGKYDATYAVASNLHEPLDVEVWTRSER